MKRETGRELRRRCRRLTHLAEGRRPRRPRAQLARRGRRRGDGLEFDRLPLADLRERQDRAQEDGGRRVGLHGNLGVKADDRLPTSSNAVATIVSVSSRWHGRRRGERRRCSTSSVDVLPIR